MIAEGVTAVMGSHGEVMTLTRPVPSPAASPVVAVRGKRFEYKGAALAGVIQQGDITVKIGDAEIAAAGWPGPPRKGDRLVIDGRTHTVQGVDTRKDGATVLMHILAVRG